MIANYHTHTKRCRHAVGEDREYVEEAIKGGMKILGFSDHAPFVFENGYVSGMRLSAAELDGYFNSLLSLKKEYEKDIKIYIGFESEYIPELVESQDRLLADYPLDYLIMGEHFSEPEYKGVYYNGQGITPEMLTNYVDIVIEGLSSGRYKYIAHPDLPRVERDGHFEKEFTRLCTFMKENSIPVEVNMLGYITKRNYPCDEFMRIAARVGNAAIIGCDAHEPEYLSDLEKQRSTRAWAEKFGIKVIDTLPGLE